MSTCANGYQGEHQWRGLYILYGWHNPYTDKQRTSRFRVGRVCDYCEEAHIKRDWHKVWLAYKEMQERA